MKTYQPWYCEECGCMGVVLFRRNAGVYEIIERLRMAHTAASPECPKQDALRVSNANVTLVGRPA